jgi:predicted  nucleic acid-binding Zn-ribbon protein
MVQWNPDGPRRWPGQQPYPHRCTECRAMFDAVAPHAELCSNRCAQRRRRRLAAPNPAPPGQYLPRDCTECGTEFEPVTARTKVCGNACKQRAIRRRKREARERDRITT